MRQADFRRIALRLPQTSEGSHMGHADFRVAGRVFATLGYPEKGWAMVNLTPEQQTMLVESEPEVFRPVLGGWGRRGSTNVRVAATDSMTLHSALAMAWRNVAPKSLITRSKGDPAFALPRGARLRRHGRASGG